MRSSTALLLAGGVLFSAGVAWAGWTSNAHVNVGGTKLGLGWTVGDDPGGVPKYNAAITVLLPPGVSAKVEKKAPNETVQVKRSSGLSCGSGGIAANVTYRVSASRGATGTQVAVKVAKVAGQKPAATGQVLAEGTGQVGRDVVVRVMIPGSCQ